MNRTSRTLDVSKAFPALLVTGELGTASLTGLRAGAFPRLLRRPMKPPPGVTGVSGPESTPGRGGLPGPPQPVKSPSDRAVLAVDGRRARPEK